MNLGGFIYKGKKFLRANVTNIGEELEQIPLLNSSTSDVDNCKMNDKQIKLAKWNTYVFDVLKGTTRKRSLYIEQSQSAEVSLQTSIAGAEIGPKAQVKYLKRTEYSYTLAGPHKYTGYLPKNRVSYSWSWS